MPLTDAAPVLLDPVCVRARVQYFLFPFFFITVTIIVWINIFVCGSNLLASSAASLCGCVCAYI